MSSIKNDVLRICIKKNVSNRCIYINISIVLPIAYSMPIAYCQGLCQAMLCLRQPQRSQPSHWPTSWKHPCHPGGSKKGSIARAQEGINSEGQYNRYIQYPGQYSLFDTYQKCVILYIGYSILCNTIKAICYKYEIYR